MASEGAGGGGYEEGGEDHDSENPEYSEGNL